MASEQAAPSQLSILASQWLPGELRIVLVDFSYRHGPGVCADAVAGDFSLAAAIRVKEVDKSPRSAGVPLFQTVVLKIAHLADALVNPFQASDRNATCQHVGEVLLLRESSFVEPEFIRRSDPDAR